MVQTSQFFECFKIFQYLYMSIIKIIDDKNKSVVSCLCVLKIFLIPTKNVSLKDNTTDLST